MAKNLWYWEYTLKIWNDVDDVEELRSGVVAAKNISNAMKMLYNYYGEEILNVLTLKAISDTVFDFKEATEDKDFDFDINPHNYLDDNVKEL